MKYTLSLLITISIIAASLVVRLIHSKTKADSAENTRNYRLPNRMIFLLILLVGSAVRIYRFGSVPAGLFVDEAAIGYNAYALLRYGIDMNGFHNPVNFVTFGSGQHALYGYLSMPFITILGLNPISTRLLSLLLGIFSLLLLYDLVRCIDDERTALAAMFFLAICPWHVMMSRWGLDCNPFPAVFLLATWLLVHSYRRQWVLMPSMLVYGLTFYAYGTAYFAVPVFLLMAIVTILRYKKIQPRIVLAGAVVFACSVLPIILYIAVNVFNWQTIDMGLFSIPCLPGEARFKQVSIFFAEGQRMRFLMDNGKGLSNIFLTQQDRWIWNAIPQFGEIYLFSMPLVLTGLVILILQNAKKQFQENNIMLFWLGAALLLGFVSPVNVNRINILFIPLVYLMAKGLVFILKQTRLLAGLLVVLYLVWFGLFSRAYFSTFAEKIGTIFYDSLGDAIYYAAENTDERITITTNEIHLPFIYVLYYQQIDPHFFLNNVDYYDSQAAYRDVASFGRWHFCEVSAMPKDEGAYIVENREVDLFDLDQFETTHFKYYTVLIPKD